MTTDQAIAYGAAILLLAVPITLTILTDRKPELLSPTWKLIASLILIGAGFMTPVVIPGVLTGVSPLSPLAVFLLSPLFVVPQGFVGAGIACVLLSRRLGPLAARNTNFMWWSASLLGVIWSTMVILMLGTSFAGW